MGLVSLLSGDPEIWPQGLSQPLPFTLTGPHTDMTFSTLQEPWGRGQFCRQSHGDRRADPCSSPPGGHCFLA